MRKNSDLPFKEITKNRTALFTNVLSVWGDGLDQFPDRHGLQPDRACTPKGCQENTLPAKNHGTESACCLDIKINPWRITHNATCINLQRFIIQAAFYHCSACMHKGFSITLKLLQDKTFPTHQAGSDPPVQGNADARTLGCTEKSVFLDDE